MPIVWVAVGGRSDLTATLIGTFLLMRLSDAHRLASQYALVVMGALLVVTVLLAPGGLYHGARACCPRLLRRGAREEA